MHRQPMMYNMSYMEARREGRRRVFADGRRDGIKNGRITLDAERQQEKQTIDSMTEPLQNHKNNWFVYKIIAKR